MNKDYIENIESAERRYAVAAMTVEKRAADGDTPEAMVVEGYAALYNSPTQIGSWFREVILPGAFDDVLKDDIRCLFNHDPNQPLARCVEGKGTLEVWTDEKGLKYRYTTPDRSYAKDLADAIEKGDVSQSSFAFRPKETVWREFEDELDLREIVKVETLYDVSPVTYPAYQDTTVGKRTHEAREADKKLKETEVRDAQVADDKGRTFREAQLQINQNRV